MWYLIYPDRRQTYAYPLGETTEEAFKFNQKVLALISDLYLFEVSRTVSGSVQKKDPKSFSLPKCIDVSNAIAFNYLTGEYIDLGEYDITSDFNPVLLLVAEAPLTVPDSHLVGKWRGNTVKILKKGSEEYMNVMSNKNIRKSDLGVPFARF